MQKRGYPIEAIAVTDTNRKIPNKIMIPVVKNFPIFSNLIITNVINEINLTLFSLVVILLQNKQRELWE